MSNGTDNNNQQKCPYCSNTYSTNASLWAHIKSVHPTKAQQFIDSFWPSFLPKPTIDLGSGGSPTNQNSGNSSSFKCTTCGKTFSSLMQLINHQAKEKINSNTSGNGSQGGYDATVSSLVSELNPTGSIQKQKELDAFFKSLEPSSGGGGGSNNSVNGNSNYHAPSAPSNIDTRTDEQKAKDLANMVAAYKEAETKAAGGDPSQLRSLDAFFNITRPEEQYGKEYNQLKSLRLVKGDGPNLGHDVLQGNGVAVYAVNERGERFHITHEMADKMRANGTWKQPEQLTQAEVDGMKFRFAITDPSQVVAINKPLVNGFMLVSGDATTSMGPETLTGNGAAVYVVNDKGERFHVTSAMAQEMKANGTWQQPSEISQAQVDKLVFKGAFNSLADFNAGTVIDRPLVMAPPVANPPQPAPTSGGSDSTTGDTSEPTVARRARDPKDSYIRNSEDSGYAYPWSAAQSTGTTDIMGTIGKAVAFMNKNEGKSYKYDNVKGTIQAEDGSFISKDDVQALNNIIVNYYDQGFKIGDGGNKRLENEGLNTNPSGVTSIDRRENQLRDLTNSAVRIENSSSGNLHTVGATPVIAGAAPVKIQPTIPLP